jgi:signal transduction histidine kinase
MVTILILHQAVPLKCQAYPTENNITSNDTNAGGVLEDSVCPWVSWHNTRSRLRIEKGHVSYVMTIMNDQMNESAFFFQTIAERTLEKDGVEGESFMPQSQKAMFKGLALAAAVVICYTIYRIKVNRANAATKVIKKIVHDLHSDIGSSASAIAVLASVTDMALRSMEGATDAREFLKKIRTLSNDVMETTEEISWSIDPKNNSIEEVSKRIRLLGSRFEDDGINFKFEIEGDIAKHKFDMETRNHIFAILKEIVTNIQKHAYCKNVNAKLSLSEHIALSVADDGAGFEVESSYPGSGLRIIKSRCEQLHANFSIISEMGMGTTIKVILPK